MKKIRYLLLYLGLGVLAGYSAAQESPPFKVIVNSSNPVASMTKAEVSKIFLKKVQEWENGRVAVPVDQAAESAVRQAFSKEIHNKSVSGVKGYWHRELFSGRSSPPPELSSDAKVSRFVTAEPDAIGYVAKDVSLGEGVKVILIRE